MNREGWVALHRRILQDDLWKQPMATRVLFISILALASHRPHKGLKAGQLRTSTRLLAQDTQIDPKSVTKALAWLEQDGKITRQKSGGGGGGTGQTLITISGWAKFQDMLRGSVGKSDTVEEPTVGKSDTVSVGKKDHTLQQDY